MLHSSSPRSLNDMLDLHDHSAEFFMRLQIGFMLGFGLMVIVGLPLWVATLLIVSLLAGPLLLKWLEDRDTWGTSLMLLSVLLVTQLFHTLEHVIQWVQFHVFGLPAARSNGLISVLDAEVIHFSWNVAVWAMISYLLIKGMKKTAWGWALWLFATAHTIEHSYMFVNYLRSGVQRLPGILGKGGWLAQNSDVAPVQLICTFAPALKTATRLDVHFWWNLGEILLIVVAGQIAVKRGLLHKHS